jgi:amino-acid N-acetyltransferase
MEIAIASDHRDSVETILTENKLPVSDLPASLENFLVAVDESGVIGVIGLEPYGRYGLLRSLAVKLGHRNQGIASKLLNRLEEFAAFNNLTAIYLLTETADKYFDLKGYKRITRMEMPPEVQQSSEFSFVCPQSAVVMKKNL